MSEVTTVKKIAPCGACGEYVDRDSMWAMDTLFASPEDGQKVRVRVRLCPFCAGHKLGDMKEMEWDNSEMKGLHALRA